MTTVIDVALPFTLEIREKFVGLACQLSPENLTCDGEAPRSWVRKRFNNLTRQWKALERQVGREVSEDEVWRWA